MRVCGRINRWRYTLVMAQNMHGRLVLFSIAMLQACQPCLTETGAEPDQAMFARFAKLKGPMTELRNEVAQFVRDDKTYVFRLDSRRVSVIDHAAESATGYVADLGVVWSAMAANLIAQIEYTQEMTEFWPVTRDRTFQKWYVYTTASPAPLTTTLDQYHPIYNIYYRRIEHNWYLASMRVPIWE